MTKQSQLVPKSPPGKERKRLRKLVAVVKNNLSQKRNKMKRMVMIR